MCILFNFLEWNMDFFMVYPKSNNAFFSFSEKRIRFVSAFKYCKRDKHLCVLKIQSPFNFF